MLRAGEMAWQCLQNHWPECQAISIYCGSGNNGGDGYVLARLARENGKKVCVYYLKEPGTELATEMLARIQQMDIPCRSFRASEKPDCDLVVDAVFGSGLARPVSGEWADMIKTMNDTARPVLALDIPSGLSADTGAVMGCAVDADATIGFISINPGCLTGRGKQLTGQLVFSDLQVPDDLYDRIGAFAERLVVSDLRGLIHPRPLDSHKGDFGRLLLVGGDRGFAGAIQMAAMAACRAGAGLVTVATREGHAAVISAQVPELMISGCESSAALYPHLHAAEVVLIGPGIGQGRWARDLFSSVADSPCSLVIDADGLRLLAQNSDCNDKRVLTPHPGEAATLLSCSTAEIQQDRLTAAASIARLYGGVCVLKGAGTVIADANGLPAICDRGNPGMSVAGMGDVLAGIIAALMAQGLSPLQASRIAVWTHASAADLLVSTRGEIGLMATDLLLPVRKEINQLLSGT